MTTTTTNRKAEREQKRTEALRKEFEAGRYSVRIQSETFEYFRQERGAVMYIVDHAEPNSLITLAAAMQQEPDLLEAFAVLLEQLDTDTLMNLSTGLIENPGMVDKVKAFMDMPGIRKAFDNLK